jgi:flagellar biosynthetic protein FliO
MNYSPDLTAAAIKMAVALVLVLAVVWGLYRAARKFMPSGVVGGGGKMIRVVENQHLGIKKNILMVQVPGELLVLGVTADKIQLLSKLDDPEIIANLDAGKGPLRPNVPDFKSQLRRLMGAKSDSVAE